MRPQPIEVKVFSRKVCRLCDKAKEAIAEAARRHALDLDVQEVDIDVDREWFEAYKNDIPVIWISGKEAFRHRVDPERFAERVREIREYGEQPPETPPLSQRQCVPCRGGVPPLEEDSARHLLGELGGGWRIVENHHLEKQYHFDDFAQALAFTNRVGAIAEEQGHHPDIHLAWGKVVLTIWTHKIDGLTESDFVLAAKMDV